uniref:Lymphocyte antigen 6 family member G6D n=1 Tax=Sus scrofa TaxID=9823 RepID=A0A4X1VA53_PIG
MAIVASALPRSYGPCGARASPFSTNVGSRVQGERLGNGQNGVLASGCKDIFFGRAHQTMGEASLWGTRDRPPPCLPPHPPCLALTAAATDASPAPCASSAGWDVPWILMLLLTVGQGLTILVLSIMLWRWRVQGARRRDASIPQFKPEIQVYENIHLAHLRKSHAVLRLWRRRPPRLLPGDRDHVPGGRTLRLPGAQTPTPAGTDQAIWKPLSDLDSSPSNLRGSPTLQQSADRVGGRCDLHDPQGLLRRGPVQQRCGEHLGPHVHRGCCSHRPGLVLARTVERVVGAGEGKGARERRRSELGRRTLLCEPLKSMDHSRANWRNPSIFCFVLFCFLGLHLQHMEVPRLGAENQCCSFESTPQPQQHRIQATSVTYTTVCGNAQCWIL